MVAVSMIFWAKTGSLNTLKRKEIGEGKSVIMETVIERSVIDELKERNNNKKKKKRRRNLTDIIVMEVVRIEIEVENDVEVVMAESQRKEEGIEIEMRLAVVEISSKKNR